MFNNEYIIVKYDSTKDIPNNPASLPYEYFNFKTFSQILEPFKPGAIHSVLRSTGPTGVQAVSGARRSGSMR